MPHSRIESDRLLRHQGAPSACGIMLHLDHSCNETAAPEWYSYPIVPDTRFCSALEKDLT